MSLNAQELLDLANKALAEGRPTLRLAQDTREGDEVGGTVQWPGNCTGVIVRIQEGRTSVEFCPESVIQFAQARLYGERVKAQRAARVHHRWDSLPRGTFPPGFARGQICRSCGLIKLSRAISDGRPPDMLFRWKELEAFYGDREEWNNKTPSCPPRETGQRVRSGRRAWQLA